MENPLPNDKTPETDRELEELVAYLDGELPADRNEAIEQQLAENPRVRHELRSLEKTWEALDQLPLAVPTSSFTKSTMELVVSSVQTPARPWWRSPLWIALSLVGPLVLGGAMYWYSRQLLTADYRQLMADLAVIERYDMYQKIDLNLTFLSRLADEDAFRIAATTATTEPAVEPAINNSERLESMTNTELKSVQGKWEQWQRLKPTEQQRFRDFHAQLLTHGDSPRLTATLNRFYEWLKTLKPDQQVDLLTAETTDDKLAKFNNLRRDLLGRVDTLPRSDFDAFDCWIAEIAATDLSKIRQIITDANIPDRLKRTILDSNEDIVRTYLRFNRDTQLVASEWFERLKHQLSTDGQAAMGGSVETQLAFVRQMLARPQISEAKLQEFYLNELSPEDREKLDSMSPEVMKERVLQLYLERKFRIRSNNR